MIKLSKLGVVMGALAASQAFAADIVPSYEIGTEVYHETYEEQVGGNKFMQETAVMKGVNASLLLPFSQEHALRFSARYAQGQSDYKGRSVTCDAQGMCGYNSFGSTSFSGLDRKTYDLRAAYEWTAPIAQHDVTTAFGLGFRDLVDHLDQARGGYRRESQYVYAHLAIASRFQLGSGWSLTPQFAYQHLLQGKQNSGGTINKQKNGKGVEFSATLARAFADQSEIRLTPFVRYWKIGDSESAVNAAGQSTLEPANKTTELGAKLSYAF